MRGRVGERAEGRNTIHAYHDLDVYKRAFEMAMHIFERTKNFPKEEKYSLTDQIRRSSRSVCSNLAEAWRKRRYPASFVSKLSDAESEAAETQVWLQISESCNYLDAQETFWLNEKCDHVIAQIVRMIDQPEKWTFTRSLS